MAGNAMGRLPDNHPFMVAWNAYKATDDYKNSLHWAPTHSEGSLWAAFVEGFKVATERAASLHESVDPASDLERGNGGEAKTFDDQQIKHMVERFLTWKLPEHFNPDCGISFKAIYNENSNIFPPGKHEPVGTNLFDYTQAEAMIRHMLEGLPASLKGGDHDR